MPPTRSFSFELWTVMPALLCGLAFGTETSVAEHTLGRVHGYVRSVGGIPIEGAEVWVDGIGLRASADSLGYFAFHIQPGRYRFRASALGFRPWSDSLKVDSESTSYLQIVLVERVLQLLPILIEEEALEVAGVHRIEGNDVVSVPSPTHDALNSLKSFPGVASRNELSNQFSVRGGGFHENDILINGFEMPMPLRTRSAEQEGLSPINSEMVRWISFYSGGFPSRFGRTLSSVVAAEYQIGSEDRLRGTATTTFRGLTVWQEGSRSGFVIGFRDSSPGRIFQSQDLKGIYAPRFTDLQGIVQTKLPFGLSMELLGLLAGNRYSLDPRRRRTFFPDPVDVITRFQAKYSDGSFEDQQYGTEFLGVRVARTGGSALLEHRASYLRTRELERLVLDSSLSLCSAFIDELRCEESTRVVDSADNYVSSSRLSLSGLYLISRKSTRELGWSISREVGRDRIDESSVITFLGSDPSPPRADVLSDTSRFASTRLALHAEESWEVGATRAELGIRFDWHSATAQVTVSPRVVLRYEVDQRTDFRFSWGVYHQSPAYRELRSNSAILGTQNGGTERKPRAQRSHQATLGIEHRLPDRRLTVRADVFGKALTNLISYTADDIRLDYSGRNDTDGYAIGLEFQVRGEFVKGLESWANYSFLVSKEKFRPEFTSELNDGWLPRPTDQRHTISLFVQDFIPSHPAWKIHVLSRFGSGVPFTPSVGTKNSSSLTLGANGKRSSDRYPAYFRVDLGMTRTMVFGESRPLRFDVVLELLNLFDAANVVAYAWIQRGTGKRARVPTRLTPRLLNAGLKVSF